MDGYGFSGLSFFSNSFDPVSNDRMLASKPADRHFYTFDIACGIAGQLSQEIWEYYRSRNYDCIKGRYPQSAERLLCDLSRLSRAWRKASMPHLVRTIIFRNRRDPGPEDRWLAHMLSFTKHTLPTWSRWVRCIFVDLNVKYPLTADAMFGPLIGGFPRLQSLHIDLRNVSFNPLDVNPFPETRRAVLALQGLVELRIISTTAEALGAPRRSGPVPEIIDVHSAALRSLSLSHCYLDSDTIGIITRAPELRHLVLSECSTDNSPVHGDTHIPLKLTTLSMQVRNSNPPSMNETFKVWLRRAATTLEHMNFSGPVNYFDDAPPLPCLRTLQLDLWHWFHPFEAKCLPTIIRLCESGLIQTLRLPRATAGDPSFIKRLSEPDQPFKITQNLVVGRKYEEGSGSIPLLGEVCAKAGIGLDHSMMLSSWSD